MRRRSRVTPTPEEVLHSCTAIADSRGKTLNRQGKRQASPARRQALRPNTPGLPLNFTALSIRLTQTCRSNTGSPVTAGNAPSVKSTVPASPVCCSTPCTRPCMSTRWYRGCSRPMRENSRSPSISDAIRVTLCRIWSRSRKADDARRPPDSCRTSSENPLIARSGARRSWATV